MIHTNRNNAASPTATQHLTKMNTLIADLPPSIRNYYRAAIVRLPDPSGRVGPAIEAIAIMGQGESNEYMCSLFVPYNNPQSAPNYVDQLTQYDMNRSHGIAARDVIVATFDLAPEVREKLVFVSILFQPIDTAPTEQRNWQHRMTEEQPQDALYNLFLAMITRLEWERLAIAALQGDKTSKDHVDVLRGIIENRERMEMTVRSGEGKSKDLAGLPVRDDMILRLSRTNHAFSRGREFGQAAPLVAMIEVLGYIDFKLAPTAIDGGRPWMQPKPRYVPEFVVTAVRAPQLEAGETVEVESALFHDAHAIAFATMLVTGYMRHGAWVGYFANHLGNNQSLHNLLALVGPEFSYHPEARGAAAETARVLHQVADQGFMLSFDVDRNAVSDYSLTVLRDACWGPDAARYFLSVIDIMFRTEERSNVRGSMVRSITMGSGYPIHRAVFSHLMQLREMNVAVGVDGLKDMRYIDTLAMLNLDLDRPKLADDYADTFFPTPQMPGQYGYHSVTPNPHQDGNCRRRVEIWDKVALGIKNVGLIERITVSNDFLQFIEHAGYQAGLQMMAKMPKEVRPMVSTEALMKY